MMYVVALALTLVHLDIVQTSTAANSCPSRLTLTAERTPQYISSPNYPGYYGASGTRLSCSWVIFANAAYEDVVIQMTVHNSSLEPATGCWRDVVEVIDGTRDFHAPLISWCGSGGPSGTFTTAGPQALVKFSTNFKDNNYNGFIMSYWIVKKPKFIVNSHPWTSINYVLLVISVVLLAVIPGGLLVILIVRKVQSAKHEKNE